MAALERALDLPLIERGTRPVQLTEAGFSLVRHARALMARIGPAEQELGEISGRRHGRLRFGSFPTALATFVPAALARFQRQHADVSLTVIDDLLDDTFQAVLPRGHRLARSGHDVSLADLADQTWVGGGPASTWFRIVRHTCRAAGFDPVAHPLPQVEIRPIRGLAPVRRIWAARPRDPFCPPAARAMIDTLQLTAKRAAAPRGPQRAG